MSAQLLDGKILAGKIKEDLKAHIRSLQQQYAAVPQVVNVAVGDHHAVCAYAHAQTRVAQEVGIDYKLDVLPAHIPQGQLMAHVQKLNANPAVNGIMVHKPLPDHLDFQAVANGIDVSKDLEGVNVINIGKMLLGKTSLIPCTPAAVMAHLNALHVHFRGKEAVIVGHSEIVGKPLSLLLLQKMATVTVCHVATSEVGHLQDHVARADILIVAVGKPELIKGDWIKSGAIVIDVGINHVGSRVVGDVEFARAKDKAAYLTPVPGGVGPVTVVMLMKNAIEAFQSQMTVRA